MKIEIPKIIHQIWSGIDEPLPKYFVLLGKTWKEHYPAWKYEFWDSERMIAFVKKYYPQYWDFYSQFPYNVQRWDAIRYLILHKIGGMYVDFDYESLEPIDFLLENKTCCFAMEPQSHCRIFNRETMFNNALMISVPCHPFMKKIIKKVFSKETVQYQDVSKDVCVWKTTGPLNLIDLFEQMDTEEKKSVYLIPDKYVTPFDVMQARRFRLGEESEELENCLKEAYAVHYFFSGWMANEK
jgi:mannosyltransferase OCH1-like enzyme